MQRSFSFLKYVKCYPLWAVAFALLFGSCVGRNGASASASLDRLQSIDLTDTLKVDTIDFGRVRSGEVLVRSLALKNSSERPVLLITNETSCGCLEMEYPKEPIKGGEAVEAKMTFFSSGYNYFAPRSFTLVTTASSKRLVVTATIEQ